MSDDVTEFRSQVKRQGESLCFPVGKSLEVALDRFGFRLGQEVVLGFHLGRLEVRVWNTAEDVRAKLKDSAEDLRRFLRKMQSYLQELPEAADEALGAQETLEGELLGMLECLIADDLVPAIHKLETVDEL